MMRTRSSLWPLLLFVLAMVLLAACRNPEDSTPLPEPTVAEVDSGQNPEQPAVPATMGQIPQDIRIENTVRPAIDPACLQDAPAGFELRPGQEAAGALYAGFNYLFCAVGAPDGATVQFTIADPSGATLTYERTSFVQDGLTVAPLTLRFSAADAPGEWVLTAQSGDLMAQRQLTLEPPRTPFIALAKPLTDNPVAITASIGGLPANGWARFALYSILGGDSTQPNVSQGAMLIATRVQADNQGIADVTLDVADLPAGPYMLLILPPDVDLGTPPTLHLPAQENLAIAVNIARPTPAGGPEPAPAETGPETPEKPLVASEEAVPPDPVPVAEGGGLPATLQVHVSRVELPACVPSDQPQLRLWPSAGEIGQWWYGCASGFAPGDVLQFSVQQANGQTSAFPISVGDAGAAPFRWYSAPGEGAGEYHIEAVGTSDRAGLNFTIQSPSAPHVLVFPHNYEISVGGQLFLAGFPGNSTVNLALYALDESGNGVKLKEWQVQTNKWGAYKADFIQAFGLESGQYAVVAQGGPAFQFAGIDLAASAIDFFAYNSDPDPSLEFYTLYLGRTEGTLVAINEPEATATPLPPTPEPSPTAAPEPTIPATSAPAEIPPASVTLPAETTAFPTCPGATADQPAICLLPATLPRGTFTLMLMHGFEPGTVFKITVTPPNGVRVRFNATANGEGIADAYWYALNDEKLGEYKVRIRGGDQTFNGAFTVVKPQQPHVVVQPRSPQAGTPIIISVAGFEPREKLLIVRYRMLGQENDQLQFERLDTTPLTTGGIGGGQLLFKTQSKQQGELFLVQIYRPGQADVLAQAVYQVGRPLDMAYPFTWAQGFGEGQ